MGSRRRGAILPPVALSVIALVVTAMMTVPVFSQSATAIAIRDIEKQTLAPGESTNVTVTITNNVAQSLSLDEDIPEGWSLTRVSDDANAYKPSTNEWVWFSVGAGETKTVIYRLTVPDNASEGDYSIVGRISNASGVIDAVKGDDIITVVQDILHITITTDKTEYTTGDIILANITIANPTEETQHVLFNWWVTVPSKGFYTAPLATTPMTLPPSYNTTLTYTITVGYWGADNFSAVFCVALTNQTSGKIISSDATFWNYEARGAREAGEKSIESIVSEIKRSLHH